MDFYGLKIGKTPFYLENALMERIAGIEKISGKGGVPKIYLKDEAHNPSGGHKARAVASAIERWGKEVYKNCDIILARITEGGFTETFGYLSQFAPGNISFASVVDASTPKTEIKRMSRYGPVVKANLDKDKLTASQIAELVREKTGRENAVVIPIDDLDRDGEGYESLGTELYDNGVRGGYRIFMPVGGGNTMAGVVHGFEKRGEVPKMHGATIPGNLFSGVPANGSGANTHLHATFSGVEREMRRLIEKYGIRRHTVDSDKEIEDARKFLQGIGIRAGLTSSVAWAAIERYAREVGFEDGESVVYLNTGYEPEESRSGHYRKIAARYGRLGLAAAAGLFLLLSPGDLRKDYSRINPKIADGWRMKYLEEERQRLARVPELADIEAYAKFRGKIEKLKDGKMVLVPDGKVLSDLTYWYFSQDMIARQMYSAGGKYTMRGSVDGFCAWKERREEANKAGKGYWDFSKHQDEK